VRPVQLLYLNSLESLAGARRRTTYYLPAIFRALPFMRFRPRASAVGGLEDAVLFRLGYYNQLTSSFTLRNPRNLSHLLAEPRNVYFHDLFEYVRYFGACDFNYVFGDVTDVPEEPALVKSRPIGPGNERSVLFKLEKMRHFHFVRDRWSFREKFPKLAWRGRLHLNVKKETRLSLLQGFCSSPLCDVGHVNRGEQYSQFRRDPMSITEQLRYKYLLSLEGVDVATNLKWIMSSNSLCFSQRPRFETWFMEGSLIPGFHYVEIADDFRDLEDRIIYYESHPDEAMEIIKNANAYVEQFRDPVKEDLLCMLVLERYLRLCSNNEGFYKDG